MGSTILPGAKDPSAIMHDDHHLRRIYLRAVYLNMVIILRVAFSFILYFTVGISLAILPVHLHVHSGYGPTTVGLVISAQYVATLLTRAQAGRMSDTIGAKRTVIVGLLACAASGGLLTLATADVWPTSNLVLLVAGRLVLGFAESWVATGAMLWGIGRVGFRHTTRVISWNGIATYGALATGAPFGVMLEHAVGMPWVGAFIMALGTAALLAATLVPAVSVQQGVRMSIRAVFWRVLPHGLGLALGGGGFGIIATFVTLFYAAHDWPHAALALSVFGGSFIGVRLLFAGQIDRRGGFTVAIASFAVECVGLVLLAMAGTPALALIGAALTGCGFSLVFPALGIEAVKRVAPADRGAALGAYSVFIDVSMGLSGPLAGIVIGDFGYSVAFWLAALAAAAATLLAVRLQRQSATARAGKG
jgi:MFS family permease